MSDTVRGSWEPGVLRGSAEEQIRRLSWSRERASASLREGRSSPSLGVAHERMILRIDRRLAQLKLRRSGTVTCAGSPATDLRRCVIRHGMDEAAAGVGRDA